MRAGIRRKLLRATLVAGTLSALAMVAVPATNAWVARAADGRVYGSAATAPSRTTAIVPGARVLNGQPQVHLRGRLETALMLYRGGRVKKILVSGNDTSSETTVMSAWLRERGVDPADILVDADGTRTLETMDHAAGIFDIRDAVICTQDVNAARSVYLAEHAGIDAVAVAVPSTLGDSAPYVRAEALKTTLAFFESFLRQGPAALAAVALR
jgi:SanA protein